MDGRKAAKRLDFSKSAYHGDKHEWRGPYASEASVTVMIAREFLKEIKKRHKLRSPNCSSHFRLGSIAYL